MLVRFILNNKPVEIDVEPNEVLLNTLRYRFGLKSVKRGCERGECGVCTVLLDNGPVYSCMVLTVSIDGCKITTIEGLRNDSLLKTIIDSYVSHGAIQCGYCSVGFILTTYALLRKHGFVNNETVIKALEGNLCRCTGYRKIIEAIINTARI